ncbi:hypothetical protein KCV06_g325, partial [Aureobasidium melanogenum]
LQDIVDAFLAVVVAVVGSSGVASVDGEELTLNEGSEVLNEVNTLNLWWLRGKERLALNTPLVELLDLDVQTSILVLHGNNTVNGAVGKASLVLNAITATGESFLRFSIPLAMTGAMNLRIGNLLDDLLLIGLAVDGAGVDNGVHNIDKDNFVSGIVQELGDEAYRRSQRWYKNPTRYLLTTTDVTTAKRLKDKGAKQSHETIRDNDNSDPRAHQRQTRGSRRRIVLEGERERSWIGRRRTLVTTFATCSHPVTINVNILIGRLSRYGLLCRSMNGLLNMGICRHHLGVQWGREDVGNLQTNQECESNNNGCVLAVAVVRRRGEDQI